MIADVQTFGDTPLIVKSWTVQWLQNCNNKLQAAKTLATITVVVHVVVSVSSRSGGCVCVNLHLSVCSCVSVIQCDISFRVHGLDHFYFFLWVVPFFGVHLRWCHVLDPFFRFVTKVLASMQVFWQMACRRLPCNSFRQLSCVRPPFEAILAEALPDPLPAIFARDGCPDCTRKGARSQQQGDRQRKGLGT